jgi:hypothetical protein
MLFKMKHKYQEGEGGAGGTGGGGDTPTVESLTVLLATANTSITKLEAKQVEILGEAKTAKDARRAADAAAETARQAQAEKDGDHKSLYESAIAENGALKLEMETMRTNTANKERDGAAMKLATGLADGYNAELLSGEIAKRLKYVDGALKVTDVNGGVTINTLEDLATEFKGNERYTSLLRGNQSTGGGAGGGGKGGGAANVITRGEFDALNPIAASKFMKDGGSVTD